MKKIKFNPLWKLFKKQEIQHQENWRRIIKALEEHLEEDTKPISKH
jgi:hypothetical protein